MKTRRLSRQRRWQLAKQQAGMCIVCGAPRVNASHCLKHAISTREYKRKALGIRRRYHHARSYQLEEKA